MRECKPHPPDVRAQAEALLRRGGMTQLAIARQVGVPRGTVAHWRCELGLTSARKPIGSPARPRWSPRQREALLRLLTLSDLDPRDLGQALGLPRRATKRVFSQAGLPLPPARRAKAAGLAALGTAPEPAALARSLRGHVARQIAAFDKRLSGREPDLDSARVLRDLAGLRRLIDDLRGAPSSATDRDSDAGIDDLARRRARLVGRLAALEPRELAERLSRRA